jgi:hypothetical protein
MEWKYIFVGAIWIAITAWSVVSIKRKIDSDKRRDAELEILRKRLGDRIPKSEPTSVSPGTRVPEQGERK